MSGGSEDRGDRTEQLLRRASSLHARGMAANEQMRPVVAARHLWAALDLLAGIDGGHAAADGSADARALRGRIRISLAWTESERGDVELGLRLLAQAKPDLPRSEIGLVDGQRGILLRRTGRDEAAAEAYQLALAAFDPRDQPEQHARVRLNRSMMHLAAVRLAAARADLDVCLTLAEEHDLPHLAAKARHNLGLLDFVAGDLPSALRAYRFAAEAYAVHAPGMLPQLSLDRARALVAAGLLTEAEVELRQVVRRLAGQRLEQDLAEAHLALAEVALLAERPADVRPAARHAEQILRRRGNLRWSARARLVALRGELLNSLPASGALRIARAGPLADALHQVSIDCLTAGLAEEARLAEVLAARVRLRAGQGAELEGRLRPRPGDRLDTRLVWHLATAESALAEGREQAARQALTRGLTDLHEQRSRMGAIDLRSGAAVHGRALARLGLESAVREGRAATILRWSELSRAQALLLPPVRPPADAELSTTLAELRGLDASIAAREDTGAGHGLMALRHRREELRRHVRERNWSLEAGDGQRRPVLLGEVRDALGDAALVAYLDLPGRVAALVLTRRTAQVVELGTRAEFAEPLRRLRVDLDIAAGRRLPARLAAAIADSIAVDGRTVAARLIDPILPLVGDRELVIVPTGPLFAVPWAALPPLTGRPVSVALSATSWVTARGRWAEVAELASGCGAAALARKGTVLAAHGPRIRYGEREVAEIARRYPGACVLSGADATADRVLAGLAEARLAHLATHGRHAADNALFSGLELVDGSLMGYDVQALSSAPALVVLSACDVGQSDVAPGDESLGMVAAFIAAGTGTVIAAVCRIGDEQAPQLTSAFYEGLAAGHRPARALADAGVSAGVTGLVCFGAG